MLHLKQLIKYIIYGGSIIATKGLEFIVVFFAAFYLTKEAYGGLEYYKKVIEVGASFFSFGFPALILSYTRSKDSKSYFYLLSVVFTLSLGIISLPVLYLIKWHFLLIPFLFYALFFSAGITQSYLLVQKGSNKTAVYKIVVSILFYSLVLIGIYYYQVTDYAFVIPPYILFAILLLGLLYEIRHQKIVYNKVRKYWKLFKKLLLSSFTLVLNNFVDLMFLSTDIFIIKMLSEQSEVQIANYSFPLNIANMLLLAPLTLIQVDIEKLKKVASFLPQLNKRINYFLLAGCIFIIGLYYIIIHYPLPKYSDTFWVFLIILTAKLYQSKSQIFGTYLLILKRFNANLYINLFILLFNIVLNFLLYPQFQLIGVATASLISLATRYFILKTLVKKWRKE